MSGLLQGSGLSAITLAVGHLCGVPRCWIAIQRRNEAEPRRRTLAIAKVAESAMGQVELAAGLSVAGRTIDTSRRPVAMAHDVRRSRPVCPGIRDRVWRCRSAPSWLGRAGPPAPIARRSGADERNRKPSPRARARFAYGCGPCRPRLRPEHERPHPRRCSRGLAGGVRSPRSYAPVPWTPSSRDPGPSLPEG